MRIRHVVVLLGILGCGDPAGVETAEQPMTADPDQLELQVGNELEVCDGECKPITTDIMRSFVVTDPEILKRFPLRRVMDQLVANSAVANTSDDVWEQWWASQRKRTFADPAHHPFCDDNGGTINGFPITCPRDEHLLEFEKMESHAPVALFNRFDLAPMDGANCGEYRIVYALGAFESKDVQLSSKFFEVQNGRNFIIFEGVLPNPHPECELAGCLPVAEFWQNLTDENDVNIRGDLLEQFYFDGVCDFEPVVLPEHYGMNCKTGGGYGGGCGQIRTNQFIEREWNLREFTLAQDCTLPGCELEVDQKTVAQNPHIDVWQGWHPLHGAFSGDLMGQLNRQMPVPDGVNFIAAGTSPRFDAGESIAQPGPFGNDYDADVPFEGVIATGLLPFPSTVTQFDIEERMTTQSCGGCHELSNFDSLGHTQGFPSVVWPPSLGFVHVDEFSNLSPALLGTFLPHRQQVMSDFLTVSCGNDCFPDADVKLVKEVVESDVQTGEPVVRFDLISVEEWERIKDTFPVGDTLSGSRVH